MKKLDLSRTKNIKPNPIFEGMPARLKNPKNYKGIQQKLKDILKIDHVHKTPSSYIACEECKGNLENKRELMAKLGFKSYRQYLEWAKIMDIIVNEKSFQLN